MVQCSPEHYRLTVPVFRLLAVPLIRELLAGERPGMASRHCYFTLAGKPVRAPAFIAGGLIWTDFLAFITF